MSREGYLYVLYHESFQQYGADAYKLGLTVNLEQRLRSYTTPFLNKAKFLYTSSKFTDCHKAERVLFYLLRSQRMAKDREFFQLPLERIINVIKNLEALSEEQMSTLYTQVCLDIVPVMKRLELANDQQKIQEIVDKWSTNEYTNHLNFDEFLEQFRFKPKDPSRYYAYGYRDPEIHQISTLFQRACTEGTEGIEQD